MQSASAFTPELKQTYSGTFPDAEFNLSDDAEFNLSDLDGSNGFVIRSVDRYDRIGWSVSGAGDVNGDGIDDLIIGAPEFGPSETGNAGSYVVFGGSDVGSNGSLDLSSLDGSNGFVLNGGISGSIFISPGVGYSVNSAGDVNGDGVDDVIIGAPWAGLDQEESVGASYVVFGVSPIPILLSSATVTVPENQVAVIDVNAIDDINTEDGGLIYTISGGDDATLFDIDLITGELNFITAPDFENPDDLDTDNIYNLQVTVTDADDLSDAQDLVVTVTDSNENPTI
ncbi:MAG: cadherin domain-containing protein, partial [Cyanobacteria bacterium P01_G01_bin.54]